MSELAQEGMPVGITPEHQAALNSNTTGVEAQVLKPPALGSDTGQILEQVDAQFKKLHPDIQLPALEVQAPEPQDPLYKEGASKADLKSGGEVPSSNGVFKEFAMPSSEQLNSIVSKAQRGERLTPEEQNSFDTFFHKTVDGNNGAQYREAVSLAGSVYSPIRLGSELGFLGKEAFFSPNGERLFVVTSSGVMVESMGKALEKIKTLGGELTKEDIKGVSQFFTSIREMSYLARTTEGLKDKWGVFEKRLYRESINLLNHNPNLLKDPDLSPVIANLLADFIRYPDLALLNYGVEGNGGLRDRINALRNFPPEMVAQVLSSLPPEAVEKDPLIVTEAFNTLGESIKSQPAETLSEEANLKIEQFYTYANNFIEPIVGEQVLEDGLRILYQKAPQLTKQAA